MAGGCDNYVLSPYRHCLVNAYTAIKDGEKYSSQIMLIV